MHNSYFVANFKRLFLINKGVIFLICAKSCKAASVLSDVLWPKDCSPSGFSVHGILQTKILEWVARPAPPRDLPDPGIKPMSLALVGGFFTTSATWEAWLFQHTFQICYYLLFSHSRLNPRKIHLSVIAVVPNSSGTRDWFRGRKFFHGLG